MSPDRLLAAVCVRDGIVVRSDRYRRWRPAGRLATALRNLDRWGADEIVVIDVSRRAELDASIAAEIAAARITTPLCVGGGIRRAGDVHPLLEAGCDRFLVEDLFLRDDRDELRLLVDLVGRQAVIGSLPLHADGRIWSGDGRRDQLRPEAVIHRLGEELVSEVLVTSVDTEGHAGTFPPALLDVVPALPPESVIWFGGLDAALAARCLGHPATAAVAFGNLLYDTELALVHLRHQIRAAAGPTTLRAVASP